MLQDVCSTIKGLESSIWKAEKFHRSHLNQKPFWEFPALDHTTAQLLLETEAKLVYALQEPRIELIHLLEATVLALPINRETRPPFPGVKVNRVQLSIWGLETESKNKSHVGSEKNTL